MPSSKNIKYKKGETWQINCILNDGTNKPLNLSNSIIKFIVANSTNANVIYRETGNGVSVTNASAGKCTILVDANLQTNLIYKTYDYEIWATLSDGTETSQIEGELLIEKSLFN